MADQQRSASPELTSRAQRFRELHLEGIFVMPCAWDAGSALVLQAAGFESLGTTSGGVNWSRGRRDYVYAVTREVMLDDYGAIADAVDLPVSGDLENGYGTTSSEVADTITAAIGAGVVGGSIEDQTSDSDSGLIPIDEAAERIAAARGAADAVLPEFVITARPESFYAGLVDPMADAIERANTYVEAGADCIFVPGISDLTTLRTLVTSVNAPVSLGIGAGGGSLALDDLREIGVRRVSTGGALTRVLYARLARAAREIVDDGTFSFTAEAMTDTELEHLLP